MKQLSRRQVLAAAAASAGAAALARCSDGRSAVAQIGEIRPDYQGRPRHRPVSPRSTRSATWPSREAASPPSTPASRPTPPTSIDARGKLVVPGLIDIHTHTARSAEGPGLVLQDGVTGWIDAGSQGADRIGDTVAVARTSPQQGRVLIKYRTRRHSARWRHHEHRARRYRCVARPRSRSTATSSSASKRGCRRGWRAIYYDEVLRRAQEVATSFNLPVMIYMGQSPARRCPGSSIGRRPATSSPTCSRRRPTPSSTTTAASFPPCWPPAAAGSGSTSATGRTVICGGTSSSAIMQAGFWPDTFSTDWNVNSPKTGVIDFPNCMSKLFGFRHDRSRRQSRARPSMPRAPSTCSATAAR